MIAMLLAGLLVCGDARDIPDPTAAPCPLDRQTKLCGCGGTLIWDPPPAGSPLVDHYAIERRLLTAWAQVGVASQGQLWWKFTEDRPIPLPGFIYTYRVWAVAADGTRSVAPSNPVKYVGIPMTCVDDVTFRKVTCWATQ